MGKRVSVQRVKLPTISVRRLRDPAEATYKYVAAGFPVACYVVVIALSVGVLKGTQKIGLNLIYWLILGAVCLLILAGGHKGRLLKRFPRSRVTGSSHQEVRLMLNQLCRLLDLKKPPEVYVIDSREVAASVRGMTRPYLVISTRLLEVLSPREFEIMLATMLGHVKAGNVRWRTFITTLRDTSPLWKFFCLPYVPIAKMMEPYLEVSNHGADKVALLLVKGDGHLLTRILVKVVTFTSPSITDEQRRQLEQFLAKDTIEARAEDVEHQMIIARMLREIPGLKERIDSITHADNDPAFVAELEKMEERMEKLQPAARG